MKLPWKKEWKGPHPDWVPSPICEVPSGSEDICYWCKLDQTMCGYFPWPQTQIRAWQYPSCCKFIPKDPIYKGRPVIQRVRQDYMQTSMPKDMAERIMKQYKETGVVTY